MQTNTKRVLPLVAVAVVVFASPRLTFAQANAGSTQRTADSGAGIAVKAGVVYAGLVQPAGAPHHSQWGAGWFAGVQFRSVESHHVGLVVEALTSRVRTTQLLGSSRKPVPYRFWVIQVPLLARIHIAPRVHALAGFSFGRRLRIPFETLAGNSDIPGRRWIQLVVGGSLDIHRLALEGRYERGLRSFGTPLDSVELGKYYVQSVTVSVSYRLK